MEKSNPTSNKKLLPSGASKQIIKYLYRRDQSQANLTAEMHAVCIFHNPTNKPRGKCINQTGLSRRELEILVDRIGPPTGYLEEFE
jgi:hypothetical protein